MHSINSVLTKKDRELGRRSIVNEDVSMSNIKIENKVARQATS